MVSNFIVYNAARERIGLLQNVDAVQWLENYQSPGEVKIDAQATPDNIAMLVDGNRIYNTDSGAVARICEVDIAQVESDEIITVRAIITAALLDDRTVMATENVTNVEAAMYAIYQRNRRDLPIEIAAAAGYPEMANTEITWNSVLDAEIKLAEMSGLGFRVEFDPETAIETFRVYRGVDRSDQNTEDYVGYFGSDIGNVQNVRVTTGSADYKNVAVVAGAGEGAARAVRIVSLGNVTGENRREMYVDARDLQREYQVATPTGEYDEKGNPIYNYETRIYSEAVYNAMLDARGMEKLAERLRTFSLTCDILQNNIFYGVDYFLGDRLPVKLPEYGIQATARIASVTKIYEKEGSPIVAVLDDFRLE